MTIKINTATHALLQIVYFSTLCLHPFK